jgi:hypothetical protein
MMIPAQTLSSVELAIKGNRMLSLHLSRAVVRTVTLLLSCIPAGATVTETTLKVLTTATVCAEPKLKPLLWF